MTPSMAKGAGHELIDVNSQELTNCPSNSRTSLGEVTESITQPSGTVANLGTLAICAAAVSIGIKHRKKMTWLKIFCVWQLILISHGVHGLQFKKNYKLQSGEHLDKTTRNQDQSESKLIKKKTPRMDQEFPLIDTAGHTMTGFLICLILYRKKSNLLTESCCLGLLYWLFLRLRWDDFHFLVKTISQQSAKAIAFR